LIDEVSGRPVAGRGSDDVRTFEAERGGRYALRRRK
jgi:hypothetical protein